MKFGNFFCTTSHIFAHTLLRPFVGAGWIDT